MARILSSVTSVKIAYGKEDFFLDLPAGTTHLTPKEPQVTITPELFRSRLNDYLTEADIDLSNPILVVTDKTRLCAYPEYLPIIIETINRTRKNNTTFPIIIAYGTHPPQSAEECLHTYGDIYNNWPFIHHDCQDPDLFIDLGITSAATPVRLRKDLLEASALITMGPICHHYFAGYGGGRKLIFPGCGEKESIYRNHGLFLDSNKKKLSPGCYPGNLDNNPVADDLFEIESYLSADLAIHGLQDSHGKICDFIIGSGRQNYLSACGKHGESYEITTPLFDTVVASCGGFPKDINFIQSHKAIHNSAPFVRDGGMLIMHANCIDGIGSKTFLPWYSMNGFSGAFDILSSRYEGNGGTALAMMSKTKRINIALVTSLDGAVCDKLSVSKWDMDRVQNYLQDEPGSIAWIANASLLVKKQS